MPNLHEVGSPVQPPPAPAEAGLLQPLVLELRHLRLVLAIEQEGGLTRAGERLNLTQSALSHQLREIESRLRLPLFDRVKNRLVLNAAGRELVAGARRVLAEVTALEEGLRDWAGDGRGLLRLTTECYTCYEWLPPLLARFERQHPRVEVRIVVEATARALDAVREGEVDLAIVTRGGAGVELEPLFEDEMLLLVAPGHRLAERPFVRPRDLARERLLLYSPPAASNFYQQFLAAAGVEPQATAQVQLTEAIVSMIRAGLGVGPLPRWAVGEELRRGTVVGVPLGERGLYRQWSAATRLGARRPRYLGDFLELVTTAAGPSRFAQRQGYSGGSGGKSERSSLGSRRRALA